MMAAAIGDGARGEPLLGYCTNVHPGETLADLCETLAEDVTHVRRRDRGPAQSWPVGLRISGTAATQLEAEGLEGARRFAQFVARRGFRVFTLNGFPHGTFHNTTVKDRVYRPDWSEVERGRYTRQLANVFAELLPVGGRGSISTVPLGYGDRMDGAASERAVVQLHRMVEYLVDIERETGRRIELALEPEPDCALATVGDFCRFFSEKLLARGPLANLSVRTGWTAAECESMLVRHVGLCLDACHAAVQFESADAIVSAIDACGARINKLQISAALAIQNADSDTLLALEEFADPVYLHQVVIRSDDGRLQRFADLEPALRRGVLDAGREEWRIHFHVPIHADLRGPLTTTRQDLQTLLARLGDRAALGQPIYDLEVETYTWDVLPSEYRKRSLAQSMAGELAWARGRCLQAGLLPPLRHELEATP